MTETRTSIFSRGCLLCLTLPLLGALVALGIYGHYAWFLNTPIPGDKETVVVIPHGVTFDTAAKELHQSGLIAYPLYLKTLAVWTGQDSKLRAGTYSVPPKLTPTELLELLTTGGRDAQMRITVLEGHTIFHIADRLQKAGLANRDVFLAKARSVSILKRYNLRGDSVEGYLYPDTYFFRQGTPLETIIDRMINRHRQVWAEVVKEVGSDTVDALSEKYGLDTHGFITLASIVEREAIVDDERPIIARVFYNRLGKPMRLQSDPTCIYGPDLHQKKPTRKLCRDKESRYSTYVIKALPPGAIANPSRTSLRAVLSPTTHAKKKGYFYFVARGDGSRRHTFSNTYKEHVKAVKGR